MHDCKHFSSQLHSHPLLVFLLQKHSYCNQPGKKCHCSKNQQLTEIDCDAPMTSFRKAKPSLSPHIKKNSPQTRVSVWRSLAVQTISKSVPKSNSSRVSSTPVLLHPPLWSFLKGYFETTPMKQMLTSVAWYQQCSFYSLYHCGVQQIGDNKYGNIKKYLGALPCFCWHKLRFSSSFVFMWFHRLPRNHLSPKETMEMGLAVYLKYQPPLHRSRQGSDKARQSWL